MSVYPDSWSAHLGFVLSLFLSPSLCLSHIYLLTVKLSITNALIMVFGITININLQTITPIVTNIIDITVL
jgi:hypothetical protein